MKSVSPVVLCLFAACGSDPPIDPVGNPGREILDTKLHFDVTGFVGTATITFGPSSDPGATLEVGDLTIDSVSSEQGEVLFATTDKLLELGLARSTSSSTVDIEFHYNTHESFQGASRNGYTFIWPYFCGNLFPCHSQPSDGTTFSLALDGVAAEQTAIYPTSIPEQAPSYQLAWSIGQYTELPLGATTAGTQLSVWFLPNQEAVAKQGSVNLVAAFDWYERTLGPYRFGNHAGGVSVPWGIGAYGGMEHHPFWHVGKSSLGSDTNIHEAAHGWFGDGIRIQCWEDFVLSEGTVSYLAARSLDVVAPTEGAAVWQDYASQLKQIAGTDPVWPQSCGVVDVLKDNLFTNAPYIRGAYFYKGLADRLGAETLDRVLATFYQEHAGGSATMAEMLETIQRETGYDPTSCADTWLTSTTKPMIGPCP